MSNPFDHSAVYLGAKSLGFEYEAKWIIEFLEAGKIIRPLKYKGVWKSFNQNSTAKKKESPDLNAIAKEILKRRSLDEPLAYIFSSWAFREFEFFCGPGVLIPRPETEELVDFVVADIDCEMTKSGKFKILDLGAGSGCLGISIAFELKKKFPNLNIELFLNERSVDALEFLKENVLVFLTSFDHRVQVQILEGDWTKITLPSVDVIVSNPPYISEAEFLELDASVQKFEPRSALVPDRDNTAQSVYQEILKISESLSPKLVAFELGTFQASLLKEQLKNGFLGQSPFFKSLAKNARIEQDMAGKERFFVSVV